jgi:hypothetical protein
MSVATEPQSKPKHRPSVSARLPLAVSLAPAPCRMLAVEVYEVDGKHAVCWEPVIGLLCIVEVTYLAPVNPGQDRKPGKTHEEMIENGWRTDWGELHPEVVPVVASSTPDETGDIRVLDSREDMSDLVHRMIVPCTWEPRHDEANAVRIGKELIKREGSIGNWVELTEGE